MTAAERFARLQVTHNTALRVSMSRDVVDSVDAFLLNAFGIAGPLNSEQVLQRVTRSLPRSSGGAFLRIYKALHRAYTRQQGIAKAEAAFYNAIASDPLLGWVHSIKRAFILDAAVLLQWACDELAVQGNALDVGCHAGYHAIWLAEKSGLTVTGVDISRQATDYANRKATQRGASASFVTADWWAMPTTGLYDMIYSVQGPHLFADSESEIDRFIVEHLGDGGVVVTVGEGDSDSTLTHSIKVAAGYGLSCGLSDVIGGIRGDEFYGACVLVFIKDGGERAGSPNLLPCDVAWRAGFAGYANASSVPAREKTQAYYRSRKGVDRPGLSGV